MPEPSQQLTPQFCFNQKDLRDFLRYSRAMVDDTIVQRLDALSTPGTEPLTATRPPQRRTVEGASCRDFKDKALFPSWQARSDLLNYCAGVATSPDPEDPDHMLHETRDMKHRERIVDARLDPYSARYIPKEGKTEALAGLIRNERSVENIIRTRTWALVGERCDNNGEGFEEALDKWRRR
ncbi:hypothetical protein K470DRAFT_211955 [Piedraia hortae CBS 480.64]|uniref:Caffeine-induced death protein Cid2 n=1 Tax=Piedraia hortae CBS 480.64 TaxID=1314780 RepID=A0A6A7C5U8_9PEZI|nr:hypothetical protein K470DRAFT_211955 [Piedraia hortae CBS 480.64]